MFRHIRPIVVGMLLALFLGMGAGSLMAAEPPKIGIILATGGLGDLSFNDLAYDGARLAAQEIAEAHGVRVDDVLRYVEPRSIADFEEFQRDFAESGNFEVIICVGFDQAPVLSEVAADYPEQKFIVIDAIADVSNVESMIFNDWEAAFLCGVVAGVTTRTGRIGLVGGMDIPLINRFAQGYTQGALWSNPEMKKEDVIVRYVGDWANPTRGKEFALGMYQSGVDVVYGAAGKSHLGVFAAAEKDPGWWAIGTDVDQTRTAPEHADVIIASGLKRIDLAVQAEVRNIVAGKWNPGVRSYGIASEAGIGTAIAFDRGGLDDYIVAADSKANLPESLKLKILEKLRKAVKGIRDGSIVIRHD